MKSKIILISCLTILSLVLSACDRTRCAMYDANNYFLGNVTGQEECESQVDRSRGEYCECED